MAMIFNSDCFIMPTFLLPSSIINSEMICKLKNCVYGKSFAIFTSFSLSQRRLRKKKSFTIGGEFWSTIAESTEGNMRMIPAPNRNSSYSSRCERENDEAFAADEKWEAIQWSKLNQNVCNIVSNGIGMKLRPPPMMDWVCLANDTWMCERASKCHHQQPRMPYEWNLQFVKAMTLSWQIESGCENKNAKAE